MEDSPRRKSGGKGFLLLLTAAVVVTATLFAVHYAPETLWSASKETGRVPAFGGWSYDVVDQRKASAALAKAGLADYAWDDGKLLVPEEKRGEYERILGESQAFPQEPSDVKQEALNRMGQFEPESRTKLRDLYSSGQQLERVLGRFDQVDSVSVGVNARREMSGLHQRNIVTATISIRMKENRPMTPELISAVTMAARHHLGITEDRDISIIDVGGGRSYHGSEGAVGDLAFASYSQEQLRQEELWRNKLDGVFGHIPGIRIATTVDLVPLDDNGMGTQETGFRESSSGNFGNGLSMTDGEGTEDSGIGREPGLLFEEDSATESKTFASSGWNPQGNLSRFRPDRIAVSISIPESYVRKLCRIAEPVTADDAAKIATDETFLQKKEEVLDYVRETAETLLTPFAGNDPEGKGSEVEVAFYGDLPALSERAFYPELEPVPTVTSPAETGPMGREGDGIALKEGGGTESIGSELLEGGVSESETMVSKMENRFRQLFDQNRDKISQGGILCLVAFLAGFMIRSFTGRRSSRKEREKEGAESRRSRKEGKSVKRTEGETVRNVTDDGDWKGTMTSEERKSSDEISRPVAEGNGDRHSVGEAVSTKTTFVEEEPPLDEESLRVARDEELKRLFEDLPEEGEEESSIPSFTPSNPKNEDVDSDDEEEVISPGNRSSITPEMAIGDNDYRIEAEPAGKPSPHFPLSALRGRRRESEERSPNPYSFNSEAFGGNGFRFQNPPEKNRHFQFLIDRTPEEIRSVLIGQRPQTVALIALVLTGNARKKLLDSLGARFREEIERRMGETEIPDERVISAVESALETTMIEKNVISPRSDHQNE